MSLLQLYRSFVREHPSLVLNVERLLRWIAWNPERFAGSEFAYEGWNAAVGLLGLYNQSILIEGPGSAQQSWALALAAVQEVQTLVELRAIHLEQQGKMSRYGPLIVLEVVRTALRLHMWRHSGCTLALDNLSQEDEAQHQSEQQLKELLQALTRLRGHYSSSNAHTAAAHVQTACQLQEQLQAPDSVSQTAAAVAQLCQPPAACASSSSSSSAGTGSRQQPSSAEAGGATQQPCHAAAAAAAATTTTTGAQQDQQRLQQKRHGYHQHHHHHHHQHQQQQQSVLGLAAGGAGRQLLTGAELLFVLRPLLYVCLLRRYGLRSWRPWLASLGLELASSYGLQAGAALLAARRASSWPGGPACSTLYSLALLRSLSSGCLSSGEQQELLVRRLQLLRYLLRSPCYNVATRRLLKRVVAASSWLPGLSYLGDFAFQMVEGMQSYYTYVEG